MKMPIDAIDKLNEWFEEGYEILHTWKKDDGTYLVTVRSIEKDLYFVRIFEGTDSYHLSEDGFVGKRVVCLCALGMLGR